MAEIISIPKHMLQELVRRSEALQRFIAPNVESHTSFAYFRSKLDEILTYSAAGSSVAVTSRSGRDGVQSPPPQPPSTPPAPPPAADEEEEIDEEEGGEEVQREVEQREVTSTESRKRKVARRTRRVARKLRIRDERQVQVPAPWRPPDVGTELIRNRSLHYLESLLKESLNPLDKAHTYLTYLRNCDFNSSYFPSTIIPFFADDAEQLADVARNIHQEVPAIETNAVLTKLNLALQQRHRLAIQQQQQIGQLLSIASNKIGAVAVPEAEIPARGRPRGNSLLTILADTVEIGCSASSLQEAMFVYRAVSSLPILQHVNEPVKHLCSGEVRSAIQVIPDIICQTANVDKDMHQAFVTSSPFCLGADQLPVLSVPIPVDQVLVNDGDGLVLNIDPTKPDPMESCLYTRLAHIDAPELCAVQYMRDNNRTLYHKYTGHHSMSALIYFLHTFVATGNGQLHSEVPKDDVPVPRDPFGRLIQDYWISWSARPSEEALRVINNYARLVLSDTLRQRVMSLANPVDASSDAPFLLNVNAFLVLAGTSFVFTKFCMDQRLLSLQAIARENKLGAIWSGASRNLLAKDYPIDQQVDKLFSVFQANDVQSLYPTGFPTMFKAGNNLTLNFPWQERQALKDLQHGRGRSANDNKPTTSPSPYGFKISDLERTGESALKILKSRVIGVGNVDTGYGLFTMRRIPENTWVCAYAPSAPFEPAAEAEGDYTLEFFWRNHHLSVDGRKCEVGLGKLINDGSWPFSLHRKYARVVQERVNCRFALRMDEVWIKTRRIVRAGEELLLQYDTGPGNAFWRPLYSDQVLNRIVAALARGSPANMDDVERSLQHIDISDQ